MQHPPGSTGRFRARDAAGNEYWIEEFVRPARMRFRTGSWACRVPPERYFECEGVPLAAVSDTEFELGRSGRRLTRVDPRIPFVGTTPDLQRASSAVLLERLADLAQQNAELRARLDPVAQPAANRRP